MFNARPWLILVAIALMPASAVAARLHHAASEARGGSRPAVPRDSGGRPAHPGYPVTPERSPARSSDDANLFPGYYGDASSLWFVGQLLTLPFRLPQLALESRGPRAFVYEGRPYAHHGKGIIRSEPTGPVLSKTGPTPEPKVYQVAAPPTENSWMPGEPIENVTSAESTDESSAIEDASNGTGKPVGYPPVPATPETATDWRDGGHTWAVQLQVDAAFIDDNTWRARPRVRFFTPTRFELDAESAFYREHLGEADAHLLGRTVDWLSLSAVHVAYRFAQSQAVQFRIGLGMRILATAKDVETGLDMAYGFDAFIHNPLVLSGSAGFGAVGQAWVTDLRATLGLVFAGIEAYAGAERIAIGDEVLAGPVVGVRVWF